MTTFTRESGQFYGLKPEFYPCSSGLTPPWTNHRKKEPKKTTSISVKRLRGALKTKTNQR